MEGDVIILSSGSEDDSDSDVDSGSSVIITDVEPLPISSVRVDVNDTQIPIGYIDLKNPKWSVADLKRRKRHSTVALEVVDLTDNLTSDAKLPTEDLPEKPTEHQASTKPHTNLNRCGLDDSEIRVDVTIRECDSMSQPRDERGAAPPVKHQPQTNKGSGGRLYPFIKLRRLPLLEMQATGLTTSRCLGENSPLSSELLREVDACRDNSSAAMSAKPPRQESPSVASGKQGESSNDSHSAVTLADSWCSEEENSMDHSTREDKWGDLGSSTRRPSSASLPSLQGFLNQKSSSHTSPQSHTKSQVDDGRTPERVSDHLGPVCCSNPVDPPPSWSKTEDVDEVCGTETQPGELGMSSPMALRWQDGSDEESSEDSRSDVGSREASQEDRHYVCPNALRKTMLMPSQVLNGEGAGTPEVLCRQRLSLVYSTIDVSYSEGTLQLLSDLLVPGFCPPKNITSHLLHGILLDPQCPPHLCVHAFHLLMRTQRHHMADQESVVWDWDLLTSILDNQDCQKKHRSEVVCMVLEYVVQTLEDNFYYERSQCDSSVSSSTHHHSIAKATLSCDRHFLQVRDVVKWLFSAIMKSTEVTATERNEQIRIVSFLQRMLSLALEVDSSPTLSSAKLSLELFHMLISLVPPVRAHRMLLLESLQSKRLTCKLLQHLLDYSCPKKIALRMSLRLLLHFMKYCTLTPDPTDGTERWHKWEELVSLLWMLLLSYKQTVKDYLCSSRTEQRSRVAPLVDKSDDRVTQHDIRDAVDAFLSRSREDLGQQALPLNVEESLTHLQDYLLEVCQC